VVTPKTIVSVLESSSAANDVVVTKALSLAQWYGSDLHVVDVRPSNRVEDGGGNALRHQLVERMTLAVQSSGAGGINITSSVLSGSPIRAIADYTGRVAADLVVVGKKARRNSGYWSTGAFAAAVGKAVRAPTIAIPSEGAALAESSTPFRNVLSAIDFSEVSLRALSEALALAQRSGGHLRLLHVLDGFPYETVYSGSRAFRLIHDFRARVARVNRELQSLIPSDAYDWSEIEFATVSGQAHEAILAAAAERPTDVIVLGLPRRPRLEQFVAGSTAHRVLRRAASPALLVPGPSTASLHRRADEHDGQFTPYPSALRLPGVKTAGPMEGGTSWR
jgi:nucleotide-binding universal stress UspA family protein